MSGTELKARQYDPEYKNTNIVAIFQKSDKWKHIIRNMGGAINMFSFEGFIKTAHNQFSSKISKKELYELLDLNETMIKIIPIHLVSI